MDYSMGMTDTSGVPTIGRTVTPHWTGTAEGSWFNDKDSAASFGARRGSSRRRFDWDTKAPDISLEKKDPMFNAASVYTPASYFDVANNPDIVDAPVDYTDVAVERAKDALYGDLGQYGLGVLGTTGLATAIAGMDPMDAFSGALSTSLSPSMAAGLMGNVVGAATGTKAGWAGNVIAGLAGLANPFAGVAAKAFGPVIGEGLGKLTGTRKDEALKQTIENTLDSNFMSTAKKAADVVGIANLSPAIADTFEDSYGNMQTLSLSPAEVARNEKISAANLLAGQVAARTAYDDSSLADYGALDPTRDAFSQAAMDNLTTSIYGSPIAGYQTVSPLSEMGLVERYESLFNPAVASVNMSEAGGKNSLGSDVGYGSHFGSALAEDAYTGASPALSNMDAANRSFAQNAGWGMAMTGRLGDFDGDQDQDSGNATIGGFGGLAGAISSASRTGGVTTRGASGLRGDLSSGGMRSALDGSHSTNGMGGGGSSSTSSSSTNSGGRGSTRGGAAGGDPGGSPGSAGHF